MNAAELTALHTETLTALQNERTLANITRRAASLWNDGYTFTADGTRQYTDFRGAVHITNSFEVKTPNGDYYLVGLTDTPTDKIWGDYCTCPAFPKYGECKHHLAVINSLRDAETEAYLEMLGGGEGEYGCDPHAEY